MVKQVAVPTEEKATSRCRISLAFGVAAAAFVLAAPLAAHGGGTPLPPPPSTTTSEQMHLTAPTLAGAPSAGHLLRIKARATDSQGAPIADAEVGCSARLAKRALIVVGTSIQNGSVTCVVRLPRGTAGSRLTGVLSVMRPDGTATRTFSALVRH
jgi:hypothetical protein